MLHVVKYFILYRQNPENVGRHLPKEIAWEIKLKLVDLTSEKI